MVGASYQGAAAFVSATSPLGVWGVELIAEHGSMVRVALLCNLQVGGRQPGTAALRDDIAVYLIHGKYLS